MEPDILIDSPFCKLRRKDISVSLVPRANVQALGQGHVGKYMQGDWQVKAEHFAEHFHKAQYGICKHEK